MTVKHKVVNFVFRWQHFADTITECAGRAMATDDDIAAVSGVSSTTVNGLRRGLFRNMQVSTFLQICNGLDLDPREFWELEG